MESPRKRNQPFGFEQGDPLVVCVTHLHMEYVQKAFQLKALYCLHLEMLAGYRFGKIIMFHPGPVSSEHESCIMRWKEETLMTKLMPGGEFFLGVRIRAS